MTVHGADMLCWSSAGGTRRAARPANDPGPGHEPLRMQDWPLRSYLGLRALPTSVRLARRHSTITLREWQMEALTDSVELLTSEIVTNAIRASAGASSRIRLWLASDRRSVLIQVWDGGRRQPVRQDGGHDAEAGRGLLLVEALSTRWGCYVPARPDGKIVWALCTQ